MDRVSLVACINDMMRYFFKRPKFDDENFRCKGFIPWSGEEVDIETNKVFMDFLEMHLAKGVEDVKLEMQLLPLASTSPTQYSAPQIDSPTLRRNLFRTDNNAKTKDTLSYPEKSLTDDANVEDGDNAAISEEDEVHDADVASVDTINWSNDDIRDLVESDSAEDASLDLTTSDDSADGDELSDYSNGAEEFAAVDDDED
ncbi:hypothetical protein OWV82_004072 [Melia azedarach]|uniref:Uncharacterized protein n=1 Tax=Melia azedarach TaxID=155640 RepID=A0ACC1YNR3_MELAZ|nr:hypothetical protein OWV82_004072 [Melia azedarach]